MKQECPLSAVACLALITAAPAWATTDIVYFGSHGVVGAGAGGPPQEPPPGSPPNGIFLAHFDDVTGKLTAIGQTVDLEHPTWIADNPEKPIIYSVNQLGDASNQQGEVVAYKINLPAGNLTEIGRVKSGGRGTTYVSFDPVTQTVFTANYASGQVTAIAVKPDGSLGEVTSASQNYGHGPLAQRQSSPHAHSALIDPSHRFVLVPDLGADRVFVYRFNDADRTLSAGDPPFEQFDPASGPRHLIFYPGGKFVYVNTELTAEIDVLSWDANTGHLTLVQKLSTVLPSFKGYRSGAEIALSPDSRHLYASNRSDGTVEVYAVNSATGKLTEIQRIPAEGTNPWSFAIDPTGHWLLVTDEGSNSVVVLKIDPHSGKLSATGETMTMRHPVSATIVPG